METFDVVGVGALNIDMIVEIEPEKLVLLNKDLIENKIKRLVPGKQDDCRLMEFEKTKDIINSYIRNRDASFISSSLGGSAANTIKILSWLGRNTSYLGLIGYDTKFLLENLRTEGIDTSNIFIGGLGSGECISVSDGRDRALRVKKPSSNDLFSPRNLTDSVMKNLSLYEIIHMTSFTCSKGYGPLDAQIKIAEELGKKVMISFGPDEFYTDLGLKMLEPILRNSYVVFLSRSNMQKLTGEDYSEGSRKLLMDYGIKYIFTTLGEDGAHLRYDGKNVFEFEVENDNLDIKPEGLTGAGDSFAAGVLYGLLKGKTPEYCTCLGIEVARMRLQSLERDAYKDFQFF